MCLNSAAAMGERTELSRQANSTDCGRATSGGAIPLSSPFPMQHGDEGEQPPGGVGIHADLALEPLLQQVGALVVERAPSHVDRLDLARGRAADRLVVAVADHEVVLHD